MKKELKERLEQSLQTLIPQVLWNKLDGYGGALEQYFEGTLETGGEEDNFRALRGIIREEINYLKAYEQENQGDTDVRQSLKSTSEGSGASSSTETQYLQPDLGSYEKKRRQALAEHSANLAEGEARIIDFRQTYLSGQVLTPDQAHALLESPVASYLPEALLVESHIPLDHEAEILDYDRRAEMPEVDHRITIKAEPPGEIYTIQYAQRDLLADEDPSTPGVNYRVCIYEDTNTRHLKSPDSWRLKYWSRAGLKKTTFLWPGSLLDALQIQGRWLARRYGWEEEDAVWFILTGSPPRLSALKIGVQFAGRKTAIKMEIAPWVSADVVRENYYKTQRQMLAKGVRELPLRSLEVFQFVQREARKKGELPSWPELARSWNHENPEWAYGDFRGLRQTYQRTRANLLPSYGLPQSKPLPPEARAEIEASEKRLVKSLQAAREEPQPAR